ncbi:MAG: hypothetical protein J5747_05275 [Spirochaetaceae bacterium]|nr:hypothetical protein [Spirochaetaceae bacterium]
MAKKTFVKTVLLTCALLAMCVLPIIAQDDIPQGIVYIKASDEENEKAVKYLTDVFYSDSDITLPNAIACGPFFWQELLANEIFPEDIGLSVDILIPSGDTIQTLPGRIIRWEENTKILQELLRSLFQASDSFVIRKLTPLEMQVYWMMIAYDIEEPIYTIESPGFNLIVDFNSNGEIFYIDNFYRLLN